MDKQKLHNVPQPSPQQPNLNSDSAHEKTPPVPRIHSLLYHFPDGTVRSLIRYQIIGQASDHVSNGEVKLWSNVDLSLFPTGHAFLGSDGFTYQLLIFWTPIYVGQRTRAYQRFGKTWHPPDIPDLPSGEGTFTLAADSSTDSQVLAPITSLHQIYQKEHAALHAARDRRVAEAARKSTLAANPLIHRDITLNYWITETPAPEKGDGQ